MAECGGVSIFLAKSYRLGWLKGGHVSVSGIKSEMLMTGNTRHINMFCWSSFTANLLKILGVTAGKYSLNVGKTSLVRSLALLCNQPLVEVALTSGSDTSDLLGGFEQVEPRRRIEVNWLSLFYSMNRTKRICHRNSHCK